MDLIVKLPLSHGFDSILVVCDRLTRAAHFLPCNETIDSPHLAQMFLDRIFRYHSLPDSIVSDRGSIFVSDFWCTLCALLQIDVKASTVFHPQTDGLTERTNQTLETYLCGFISYQQDDWPNLRSTISRTDRHVKLPSSRTLDSTPPSNRSSHNLRRSPQPWISLHG